MLGLLDDDEEVTTNRNDSQEARVKSEAKVANLMNNFGSLDVFGIEAKRNSDSQAEKSKLTSIAIKDVCNNLVRLGAMTL